MNRRVRTILTIRDHRWLALLLSTGILTLSSLTLSLRAHTIPVSYLTVVPGEGYIHVELLLNSFELAFFPEIDANRNGRLDASELEKHEQRVAETVFRRVELETGGTRIEPEVLGIASAADHHLTLRGQYPADVRRRRLIVRCNLIGITHAGHVTVIKYVNGSHMRSAVLEGAVSEVDFRPPGSSSFEDTGRHFTTRALTWQHVFLVLSVVGLANVLGRQVIVPTTFIGGQVLAPPLRMLISVGASSSWLPWGLVVIGLLLLTGTLRGRKDLWLPSLLLPVLTAGICSGVFLVSASQAYGATLGELLPYVLMLSVIECGLVLLFGLLLQLTKRPRERTV